MNNEKEEEISYHLPLIGGINISIACTYLGDAQAGVIHTLCEGIRHGSVFLAAGIKRYCCELAVRGHRSPVTRQTFVC